MFKGKAKKVKDEDAQPEFEEEDIEDFEVRMDGTGSAANQMAQRNNAKYRNDSSEMVTDKKDRPLSQWEIQKAELDSAQVIPDSEISPAAFIFARTEEEQQQILFEEKSQKVKCPHCDSVSYSIVAYETNLLGYLLAVMGILVFGIMSMIMMPFLVGLTKQAVHKCAKCLNDVKQSNLLGLNSLEDKVIAKKVGGVGVILTRRYLLYIVMVIFSFLSIYMFVLVEEKAHEFHLISDLTWDQFRDDCGFTAFSKNPRQAFRNFEMQYFGKQVGWDGYIVRVNLNDEDPMSVSYHTANIMVKMATPDIPEGQGADIGVTLSERNLEKYSEVIENLHIGDHVAFNATLISLGDRHHLHHLRAFNIEKVEGHMDVQAHAHTQGRYKLILNHTASAGELEGKVKHN